MSDCAGCINPDKYGHNTYCPESRIDELKARLAEQGDIISQLRIDLAEAEALLRELDDCGAIANWMRVSDELRARITTFRIREDGTPPLPPDPPPPRDVTGRTPPPKPPKRDWQPRGYHMRGKG